MKDFKDWGMKVRVLKDYNYRALWYNLKTVRFGESKDDILELPPNLSEFYDVGINTKCNAECPFCYVSASNKGINYPNICDTWSKWMKTFPSIKRNGTTYTLRPFQIAIGEF